eukprot:751719-Hanusia_phi.AAC.1
MNKKRKRLDWHEWADTLPDYRFRVFYRMCRDTFDLLLDLIRDQLEMCEMRAKAGCPHGPISPELQLSMTLRWLAGGSYLDIHHFHGVSQAAFW